MIRLALADVLIHASLGLCCSVRPPRRPLRGWVRRVVAGPGSGKTRVLAARAADLILSRGVPPWRIMALTFTNKAGDELKGRLASVVGAEAAGGMVAGERISSAPASLNVSVHGSTSSESRVDDVCTLIAQGPSTLLPPASSGSRSISCQGAGETGTSRSSISPTAKRCFESF